MEVPQSILVPTDFSEIATGALDYAVALASRLEAKVHLVHVVPPQASSELGFAMSPSMVDGILQGTHKELDRLVIARAGACAFGPTLLEVGEPREKIAEVAERLEIDLIVIGSHGRRGFKRLLIGSVAEGVARICPCPILIVRPTAP